VLPRLTTRNVIRALIQEDRRPPTWRWEATARHGDLLPGLWEWRADASREGTLLARKLIQIEQDARWRWPTRGAAAAADDEWWKRQP